MAVTRIKNNQITDLTVNAAAKLQDFSVTSGKIANNLTYGSDLTITGNLTVQGNVTAIDTTDLVIEDPLFLLAKDQTGTPTLDIGFIGKRGTEDNIAWVWDESAGEFAAVFTTSEISNTVINIDSYASIHALDITAANLDISGNITFSGNIVGNVTVAGNVDAGNVNAVTSVTGTTITASGNLAGNNAVVIGDVGAATVTATGNVSGGNLTTAGVVEATGNVSGGNLTTAGVVEATGNVSGGNVVTVGNIDGANVNASAEITAGTTIVATGNVSGGNITTAGNVDGGNLNAAASVTGAGAVFSGNVTAANFIGNIQGNIDAGGANTNIQFNDDDILNGSAAFSFDKTSNAVTATGNVTAGNIDTAGSVVATGNVSGGNLVSAADVTTVTVTATGNVAGGNLVTLGNVDSANINATAGITAGTTIVATGNVSGGNVTTTGNVDGADLNATAGITAGTTIVATGNVSGGNVTTAGNVDGADLNASSGITAGTTIVATGNIAGGNISTAGRLLTGTLETTGDALIGGNLIVQGNLTFINVEDLRVEDPIIILGTGPNGVPLTADDGKDRGIYMEYFTTVTANAFMGFQNISGNMIIANDVEFSGNDIVQINSFGNLNVGNLFPQSLDTGIGNVTAGNLNTAGQVVATGNVSGGNVTTAGAVVATGNVVGGNVNAALAITAGTTIAAIGNISGGNITTSGNVTGEFLIANSAVIGNVTITDLSVGNIDATGFANIAGNVTGGNFATAGSVIALGDVLGFDINASGNVVAEGDISTLANVNGGNLVSSEDVTTVTVTATGIIFGNGINSSDVISASGDISGFNFITGGNVDATGNVIGGNITTVGEVTATGNVSGGNITTVGEVTATGNVSGDFLLGNVEGATATFSGNVTADTVLANVDAATATFSGNVTADFLLGNVEGATATFSGNVTADNFIGNIQGNIDAGGANTNIQFNDDDILAGDANFTFDKITAQVAVSGSLVVDNVVIDGDDITSSGSELVINSAGADINFRVAGDSVANLLVTDASTDTVLIGTGAATVGAAFKVGTTDSILVPVGNTVQRPGTPVTGMVRFNTTLDALEYFDSSSWESTASEFTIVTADTFNGDGSTVVFALSEDSTTAATIVAINGVVQQPTTAYSVAGNVLTFTEAPEATDVIDARLLTTTTTVTAIQNGSGNAVVEVLPNADTVQITGNLLPSANVTFDLGSDTLRWRDIYLANSTIYLGNAQISANATAVTITDPTGNSTVLGGTSASITVSEIIKSGSNGVGNIGSASNTFDTVFAKATSAQYADLAEMYEADADYDAGTVLCFGGAKEVTLCGEADSTRVAGVVSTNPSYLMNSGQPGEHVVAVALTGRVPTLVQGAVRKGDLMVCTAQGRACANNAAAVGTVIGKALEDFDGVSGMIEVVVGRV